MAAMELKNFSQAAQRVLLESQKLAKKNHNTAVEPEHLALALIMTSEIRQLLSKKNIEYKELERALLQLIANLPVSEEPETKFGGRIIQALSAAEALSISKGNDEIKVSDMLLSLLENKDKYGSLGSTLSRYFLGPDFESKKVVSASSQSGDKSYLSEFVDNINDKIKNDQIAPVFGRAQECERLIQILSRKSCNNAVLIGEPGVGRTSIVMGLAKRIVEQKVPSHLITKEILALDVSALVSGTTLRGQFEERVRKIFDELLKEPGKYIIFMRDLTTLMGAGGEGALDAANLLKPRLATGEVQVIGLVTPDSYKKRIEKDPSFERYFQPLWVDPPSTKECEEILHGLKGSYEGYHGVFIEDDALFSAIDLSSKHLSGRVLPEVALDVLDEACSRHRILIDQEPLALANLNARIEAAELKLSKAGLKESALKKVNDELLKLTQEKRTLQASYERELSLIESMRALKANIAKTLGEITKEKERKNMKKAAALSEHQLMDLDKELQKKERELKSLKKAARFIDPWVKREDIAEIISQETGIPVQRMIESERNKLARMEDILSNQVIGQKEAVSAVSAAIRRARVGLKDPKKPIGSFLFLGPTGVGKTELARTLSSFLFDDERAMVRFDMSEFMERHSVARLIGSPPGYQGSDEGGQLTECIRRKPFSVILFDEIEKAHVDVLNILLQVLDEGRLTDSKGRLVNFNHCVVIMTSNIGADILLGPQGRESPELLRSLIMERLLIILRPELINRIDEIVIFNAIDKKGIIGIAELMLATLIKRIEKEGFFLTIDQAVKNKLVEEGYSHEFGARPLKRTIQRLIENPLAMLLVQDDFKKGDHIEASLSEGQVVFGNK